MAVVIAFGQPMAAQALNWGDLIPRILPGLIQTIQLANISDQQEMDLGRQINQQLTTTELKILRDPQLTTYINEIGQRLIRNGTRKNINYTFQIVDDKTVNAAATMGGFVYINKGIIDAADNEAELASVIAHEISHVQERHSIQQAKNAVLTRTGAAALNLDRNLFVNLAMQFGLTLPRSRQFELTADEVGLRLLTSAGYSPQAMVTFMQKLDSGPSLPSWLSSHPATRERIRRLQALVKQIRDPGNGGTDVVAYAQRVGKPRPNAPVLRQSVVLPQPAAQPVQNGIVVPTD
jgi:predicted Zn-dependent protease